MKKHMNLDRLTDAALILLIIGVYATSLYTILTGDSPFTTDTYTTLGRWVQAIVLVLATFVGGRAYMGLRESKRKLRKLREEIDDER